MQQVCITYQVVLVVVVHMYLSAVAHVRSNDVEIQGLPCMTDGLVQHTKHVVRLYHVGDLQGCITRDARRMFVCVYVCQKGSVL